jgi:hypothetical protein
LTATNPFTSHSFTSICSSLLSKGSAGSQASSSTEAEPNKNQKSLSGGINGSQEKNKVAAKTASATLPDSSLATNLALGFTAPQAPPILPLPLPPLPSPIIPNLPGASLLSGGPAPSAPVETISMQASSSTSGSPQNALPQTSNTPPASLAASLTSGSNPATSQAIPQSSNPLSSSAAPAQSPDAILVADGEPVIASIQAALAAQNSAAETTAPAPSKPSPASTRGLSQALTQGAIPGQAQGSVPSIPIAQIVPTPAAVAPIPSNRVSSSAKTNSSGAPTVQSSIRSSTIASPANDSAALQNEFSLASAVVFPAASVSTNLPSVHALLNASTATISQASAYPPVAGTSSGQNSSNSTASTALATGAAASANPGSPKISASAITTATGTNSTSDHSLLSVASGSQLAASQTPPSPAPTPAVASTSSVLTPSAVDSTVPLASKLPASTPPSTPGAASELPQPALPVPSPVQMAQMVNRASQSEMRIGLNTSAFGNVEVRTVVHASDVGLSVGSEKGDLHSLLSNELPAIANSLQQQNLRLTQVNFHQGGGLSGNLSSGGESQQQRSFSSPAQPGRGQDEESPSISLVSDDSSTPGLGAGLSILA